MYDKHTEKSRDSENEESQKCACANFNDRCEII